MSHVHDNHSSGNKDVGAQPDKYMHTSGYTGTVCYQYMDRVKEIWEE